MRLLCWILVLALQLAAATPALAWGERGHRLIADVAYEELTPQARVGVDRLVASDLSATPGCPITSFEEASNWSDCVRRLGSYRNQSPWHYDNIPICGRADYAAYCANGNCATAAIARAIRSLRNSNTAPRDQQRALARLVHIIGDIHQPLHASDNGDRGGNEVAVTLASDWSGPRTARNLHAVWDSALVDYALGEDPGTARRTIETLAREHAEGWASGDPRSWTQQTHQIARSLTYGALTTPPSCNAAPLQPALLDQRYQARAAPVVREQLAKASVRLAATLNQIFR